MPRKRPRNWDQIPEVTLEEEEEDLRETTDEEPEEYGEEPDSDEQIPEEFQMPQMPQQLISAPVSAEDDHQRYERELDRGVIVEDRDSYNSLRDFVGSRSDRDKYRLRVYRCDPDMPKDRSKENYLDSHQIPEGLLEDLLKDIYGGGVFRWQLAFETRFVGRKDLPPTMRSIPLSGYCKIEAPPKRRSEIASVAHEAEMVREMKDRSDNITRMMLDSMKEQMERVRTDSRSNTDALVAMSNVMLQGMQAQMQMSNQIAAQQNTFLMGLLDKQDSKSKDQIAEKDQMWGRMMELVMKFTGNSDEGPKSTLQIVMDGLKEVIPPLIPAMKQAMVTPAPSSPPTQQLPPPAPEQPAATQSAPQGGTEDMWALFMAEVVKKAYQMHQIGMDPEVAAEQLDRLGSDEDNARLCALSREQIIQIVSQAHQQYLGGPAPQELVNWVGEVWDHLTSTDEEEEQLQMFPEPKPEAPAAAPVVPTTPPAVKEGEVPHV